MKITTLSCMLLSICLSVASASAQANSMTFKEGVQVPIWPSTAPGSEQWTLPEQVQDSSTGQRLINVTVPTLTVFYPQPAKATGTAAIIAAGGGFRTLPDPTKPDALIKALTERGVTAIMLKYRLMQNTAEEQAYRSKLGTRLTADDINRDLAGDYMKGIRKIAADDGRQAIKLVREYAKSLGVQSNRIGVIGFSSGGVLATTMAIEYDATTRPDFIAVFYGSPPDAVMNVPADAPPHFIATVSDDAMTWKGSLLRYEEWNRASRPVELHIYGKGGHGFSKSEPNDTVNRWKNDFFDWLVQQGFLPKQR